MGLWVSLLLAAAVAAASPLSARLGERARLGLRLGLGAAALGLGGAACLGRVEGADALQGALWMVGGAVGAAAPWAPARGWRAELVWLGWALGPLSAAALLGAPSAGTGRVQDDVLALLWVSAGALLALAAAFVARGLGWLARGRAALVLSAPPLAAGALGALALRLLMAPGLERGAAHLPAVGADGQAPVWLTEVARGLPLVSAGSAGSTLAGLLGLGALLAVVAAAARGRLGAGAALASAAALLGAAGWMISAHGQPVEPNAEAVRALLAGLGAPEELSAQPRLLGQAPFAVSLRLMGAPLALALTGGLGALGLGAASWWGAAATAQDAWDDMTQRLAARDAAQLGALCVWLSLAALLLAQRHAAGIWGPTLPAEHLLSGAALLSAAAVLALHGLGGAGRAPQQIGRALAFTALVLAIVGAAAGGLVSGVGVFSL
jgi:hypothetical protein